MAADRQHAARLARGVGAPEVPLPFETDPTGFPMVWVEAISAWMHWLPVTKAQFERYLLAAPAAPEPGSSWYEHLLALNPRVAPTRIRAENYRNALLTGVVPSEAQRFAAWLGKGFAIPTLDEWLRAWATLEPLPAERGLPAAIARTLEEPARTLTLRLESALAAGAARPRRHRTLADQMLLRGGVLEWVEQPGRSARWVGIGEPPRLARGPRVSPERGPVAPDRPEAFRSYLFGFRLLRRPV
jgi:formylglycine-generating enzyme required for sulfatase activity